MRAGCVPFHLIAAGVIDDRGVVARFLDETPAGCFQVAEEFAIGLRLALDGVADRKLVLDHDSQLVRQVEPLLVEKGRSPAAVEATCSSRTPSPGAAIADCAPPQRTGKTPGRASPVPIVRTGRPLMTS